MALILFTLIMTCVGCCVSAVITFRWTATLDISFKTKILVGLILTFIFIAPFLLRSPPKWVTGNLCNALLYITYFGFVCLFLFFCFIFIRDGLWLVARWLGYPLPGLFHPASVLWANIGLSVFVLLLSFYALYAGIRTPAVKEITLTSDKINRPLTLVVLSDLHLHRALSQQKLHNIVLETNALNPDLILLPGDTIDDHLNLIPDLLPVLKNLSAPLGVFITDGNHEFYNSPTDIHYQFQKLGLTYLENNGKQVRPDVWVGGVPDIQAKRFGKKIDIKGALTTTDAFRILLAHTPKMFDFSDNTADLQVSGHTHGGQLFPMHFLTKWANRYLAGLYQKGNRFIYVSRGSGQWGPQMRLFAPSEITLIKIYPTKTDFK